MERFVIFFLLAFIGIIQGLNESHNQEFEPEVENDEWTMKKDPINDPYLNLIPNILKQQHLLEQQLLKQKQQQEWQQLLENQPNDNLKKWNEQQLQKKYSPERKNLNEKCDKHLRINKEQPMTKSSIKHSKMTRPNYQNSENNLQHYPKQSYFQSSTTEAMQPVYNSASNQLSEKHFTPNPISEWVSSLETTTETDTKSTSVSGKQSSLNNNLRKYFKSSENNQEAFNIIGRKQISPTSTLRKQNSFLTSNIDTIPSIETLQDLSVSNTIHSENSGSSSNGSSNGSVPKTVILPVKTSRNVKCYRNDLMIICID